MTGMPRRCAWCAGPIRPGARRDAITCSTPCRQARARFAQDLGTPPSIDGGPPLHLAYADPPYPGLARRYYRDHPDYAGEVDHAELISTLVSTYDGWALSTSARALPDVLPLCPPGTRVAAWHRGERPPTRSADPGSAWEPVLYVGGRRNIHLASTTPEIPARRVASAGKPSRRIDSLVYRPGHRLTDPGRVIGTKPAAFIRWVFDLLGALPGDEFVDVFPGSGGVTRAWAMWTAATAQPSLLEVHS